jgi:hypothetical protein
MFICYLIVLLDSQKLDQKLLNKTQEDFDSFPKKIQKNTAGASNSQCIKYGLSVFGSLLIRSLSITKKQEYMNLSRWHCSAEYILAPNVKSEAKK